VFCRFINADDISALGVNGDFASYNLFAYCGNNPIDRRDESGMFWKKLKEFGKKLVEVATAAAEVVVAAAVVVATVTAAVGAAALIMGTAGTAAIALAPVLVAATKAVAVTAGVVATTMAVGAIAIGVSTAGESVTYAKKSPTSRNQMQEQVKRGQAPKNVDRVDKPHVNAPNQQNHVHFKDGTALNMDGSISHESKGVPNITDTIFKWLVNNGWGVPHV